MSKLNDFCSKYVDPPEFKIRDGHKIKKVESIYPEINKIYKEIGGFDYETYIEEENYLLGKRKEREF